MTAFLYCLYGDDLDLLAVELAAADQLVHQRVVLGEDVALVLAREIHARIADVRDEAAQVISRAGDQQHGRRRAHAALVGLGLRARVHRTARRLDRVLEHLEDLVGLNRRMIDAVAIDQLAVVVHRVADLVDRDRRSDFAGGVTAHAVRDQEQPELLVDEEVILVVIPLPADVGRCGERELHRSPQVSWNPRVG